MRLLGWIAGLSVVVGAMLAGACSCDPEPSGPRGTAQRCSYGRGDAGSSEPRVVEIGELQDDVFVPWIDGGEATMVRGFQGSDMILPVVRVPAMASDPDEVCALVDLSVVTSEGPTGSNLAWILRREGDFLQSGSIEMPLFVGGTVTVSGEVREATFVGTLAERSLTLR
ncbi:MAG: hypothetical protein H6721_06800 [Sandaracinus sp.]|nr:hypothetical protein [Myxococcales bacterium]MCB9604043.1 hypothetical protein [Sandaracinus sp.]MCB9612924.1 hypothetical protein [Sandaracinus sp.]MCB9631830.1 hypothetical protein [Sandaracinus sp.]